MDNFFSDLKIYRKCRKSLHLLAHQLFSLYSLEFTISERIWGVILELVASIAREGDIMDEEVLEAAVDESDGLAHICELYRCKNGESRIPEI